MFLLIDKPKGITSHDVVNRVRKITGVKRVGHGGTLDPNATGLLIVAVGREFTKQLSDIAHNTQKIYEAEIRLGETRDTDDVDGEVTSTNQTIIPTKEEIEAHLQSFLGQQEQLPPQYSALKVKGKAAYAIARKGQTVALKPRTVTIYSIELLQYGYPIVKITLEVSSGTYIRAIARDLGEKLGCGAYLKELRRTKIGEYHITNALTLEKLESLGNNQESEDFGNKKKNSNKD
jgi:tRNA pseudouridine55 synthase